MNGDPQNLTKVLPSLTAIGYSYYLMLSDLCYVTSRTSGYTVGITLHSATLNFDGNSLSLAKIFKRQQLVVSQVRCPDIVYA